MKKFIIRCSLFFFPIIIIIYLLSWIREIPSQNAIENKTHKKLLKWAAIKNPEKQYHNIILGSSRGYCSYNPTLIDSIQNKTTFNMCTGSQHITETYYVLKEILKYQKPKTIIYEIYLSSFIDEPDFYHVMSNASFMSKKGKWEMIFGFGNKGLLNNLIPLLKHKPYIKRDLKSILKSESPISNKSFWDKGYLYDNHIVDSVKASKFGSINPNKINSSQSKTIKENLGLLIELCRENNINLICVRAPYPKTRLKQTLTDTVSKFFKEFLGKKAIPFFDFNYISDSDYYDSDFTDRIHMNTKGATKVSIKLGEILKTHTENDLND